MNKFQAKYTTLFTIVTQQLFYLNNLHAQGAIDVLPDFEIVPSPECISVLKKLDYIVKTGNPATGITVLARVSGKNGGGDDLLRFKPAATDKLSFYLMMRNKEVINFNKLPLIQSSGRLFYFSNEVADGAALRSNLHVSAGVAGVHETNDAAIERTDNYSFTLPAATATGSFIRHLVSGGKTEPVSIVTNGALAILSFKLAGLPAGKYQLFDNGLIKKDEFYYNGSPLASGAWGVIEIMLSSLIAANYRIAEPDFSIRPEKPVFTLLFENRLVKWRYTVKLETNSALYKEIEAIALPADKTTFVNAINIVTNDGALAFTLTPPAAVIPAPAQLEFISNTVLGFKEKYFSSTLINKPLKLDLKKNIGMGPPPPTIKENLPHPGTALINPQSIPDIFSEIFITI